MKSKMIPVCVDVMDMNDDGALEIVSAWSGGKVEARSLVDGALIFKDQLPSACAGLIVADYRLDSRQHCVVVTVDGLVRGYSVGLSHALFDNADAVRDESQMEQLNQELLSLQQQLRNFEMAVEEAKGGKVSGDVQMHVPADTSIVCRWAVNESRKCVDMVIATNNKTVINAVVLMADHIFGGESKVFYPSEPACKVHVPFVNESDKGTDVYVKVFVSARSSSVFHIFERGYRMPQFSMFVPFVLNGSMNQWPKSFVRFKINERTPDLSKWLNTSFNIQCVFANAFALLCFFLLLLPTLRRYVISPQAGIDLGFRHINSNELVHVGGAPSGDQFSVLIRFMQCFRCPNSLFKTLCSQ
jgi:Bardet-Biedl syndrome 2 protein